jgi:integrase
MVLSMVARKITLPAVKALNPSETIWDTDLKGFGCRCQKADKVFFVKYRFGVGRSARQHFYTIGKWGDLWTPESARQEAKRILGRVANGENPAAEKTDRKRANSISEAFDQFMQDGEGKRGKRTQGEYRRMYDRFAGTAIGKHRVQDVIRGDISKLHLGLKSIPSQANRLLQMLSAFFTWCEKLEYRADGSNPCRHIDKYKEKSRERFMSEQELFALSKALGAYEQEYRHLKEMRHKKDKTGDAGENAVTPYITAVIRMLILTGARRGEILTLKWSDVDFKNRLIRLQESKTGQKTIYLSAPALQLLSELPRIEGNPHVFCGREDGACLVNIKDPWKRISQMATIALWREDEKLAALIDVEAHKLPEGHRIGDLFDAVQAAARKEKIALPAGLMDVHIHDLRHNFASVGVGMKYHLKAIGALLGHSNSQTTERYAHLSNDPLQTANEAISSKIFEVMTTAPKTDNVVNIRK